MCLLRTICLLVYTRSPIFSINPVRYIGMKCCRQILEAVAWSEEASSWSWSVYRHLCCMWCLYLQGSCSWQCQHVFLPSRPFTLATPVRVPWVCALRWVCHQRSGCMYVVVSLVTHIKVAVQPDSKSGVRRQQTQETSRKIWFQRALIPQNAPECWIESANRQDSNHHKASQVLESLWGTPLGSLLAL